MSSRKRYAQRKNRKSSGNSVHLNGIQWAAIGVVVIVVAAVLWLTFGRRPSAATTGASAGVTPVVATGTKQWSAAPPMTIDPAKKYYANITMARGGQIVIQLFPDKAPITVNSFVFLANQGFYNGTTFHRVLEGFMAQGGDPTGTGSGGPGYEFANELNDLTFDKAGVVAMANAGRDTNGSQFFITFGPTPQLTENDYTIFGQVTSGMDVVNGITRRDPDTNPTFPGDTMQSVTITTQ